MRIPWNYLTVKEYAIQNNITTNCVYLRIKRNIITCKRIGIHSYIPQTTTPIFHYHPNHNHTEKPISQLILKLRDKYPCYTLQQITDMIDNKVSRERVRQILKTHNKSTKHLNNNPKYKCLNCGKLTTRILKSGTCSIKCQKDYNLITLICDNCGKSFKRIKQYLVRNNIRYKGHQFCCRKCCGKYKQSHRIDGIGRPVKYDYNKIAELYNNHMPITELVKLLNINYQTIANTIYKLRKTGKIKTPKSYPRYDKETILSLYKQGIKPIQISKQLNIRYKSVRRITYRYNRQKRVNK